jgi:hypothetical protein
MNTEERNKEMDLNEMSFSIEVEHDVIDRVKKGDITHLLMDISEDNQNMILGN